MKLRVKFLGTISAVSHDMPETSTIQAMGIMAAVHKYFRDLDMHARYYRFMKKHEHPWRRAAC